MGNASKDSANPYFKSKYADLNSVREACLPSLNKHGISVLQPIVQMGREVDNRFTEKSYVKTILLHESGETIESLTEIVFGKANDAQAQGSGITYARRYGLQSLVCIGAEDDDGNKASETKEKKNASGLSKEAGERIAGDMKETQEMANKTTADRLMLKINGMGSVAELEGWLEDKAVKSAYAKLEKYAEGDFARVKVAELAKLAELDPEGK